MNAIRLVWRSFAYFRAAHLALLAGMVLVTAVLTGALILGDSVRDSLADLAQRRSGGYEKILTAPHFFSQGLADRATTISGWQHFDAGLVLPGRARSERTALSSGVQMVAIPKVADVLPGGAWISRTLAESLGVGKGDALLVTLPAAGGVADAVLARRDRASALASLRVTVERILDDRSEEQPEAFLAWFDAHPSQRPPVNIWLNMMDLKDALQADVPPADRIPRVPANVLLVRANFIANHVTIESSRCPPTRAMTLEDYGLELSPTADGVLLRSANVYIAPRMAAALHPFKATGQEVYTLLLDQVAAERGNAPPLSYVIAAGITGHGDMGLKDDEAAINQWTADQLHVQAGDTLQLTPYHLAGDGTVAMAAKKAVHVTRIIPMTGVGADATLTPNFHGLTDAATMAQWNPPAGFPFDRSRVTPADETYWNEHQAAPKILLNLITAQRLVKPETPISEAGDSAGEITSLRLPAAPGEDVTPAILQVLTPEMAGFPGDDPNGAGAGGTPALRGGAGGANTDFAGLFLGLSGFLLIAALLLVALLFRLAVEQRARQMGLLGALGFSPRRVGRIILAEGALVAAAGTLTGLPAAVWYTGLLVHGLGTWWIGATGTQAIGLHVHQGALMIGGVASLLTAMAAMALTTWRMMRATPVALLQGNVAAPARHMPSGHSARSRRGRSFAPLNMAPVCTLLALVPVGLAWARLMDRPMAFLLSGFLLLAVAIATLARVPVGFRRARQTLFAIAAAGMLRQRTRAILCVALMSAAVFLLVSVTAFQSSPGAPTPPPSPTGGYQLIITTQIPLPADLQTPAGRKLLGVPENTLFDAAQFTPLRVGQGDDISCLNMMQPISATLVGVPPEVLKRLQVADRAPRPPGTDAIAAAVDEQTAQYILHAGLGEPVPQLATPRPVMIDTLLTDSIFQSYALIPEQEFARVFPQVTGSALVLVDCPPASVQPLRDLLRRNLDDFGVTVETTPQRLAAYHAVADSYIAAFQFLGVLGLMVGALGLVVVLARNVIQRRAELALLQALGFTRGRVTLMLVIEHGSLLLLGLLLGVAAALVAVTPQIGEVRIAPVAGATGIILLTGLMVLAVAARLATGRLTPAALRQD